MVWIGDLARNLLDLDKGRTAEDFRREDPRSERDRDVLSLLISSSKKWRRDFSRKRFFQSFPIEMVQLVTYKRVNFSKEQR